jgi:hypothetical protein
VLARGVWTQMRENAQMGKQPGRVLDVLARSLADLDAAVKSDGKRLELHFIGHSAGSILFGHLLERLASVGGPRFRTCTLFAPACSVSFATRFYLPAADAGLIDLERFWIHCLSDSNEKRDGLPTPKLPAYGKSLLYLVSRALEDTRKMPLLGLERALDKTYRNDAEQWAQGELPYVRQWLSRWDARLGIAVNLPEVRTTKEGARTQATHGSFDNNLEVLTMTLERIRGSKLVAAMEWLDYD